MSTTFYVILPVKLKSISSGLLILTALLNKEKKPWEKIVGSLGVWCHQNKDNTQCNFSPRKSFNLLQRSLAFIETGVITLVSFSLHAIICFDGLTDMFLYQSEAGQLVFNGFNGSPVAWRQTVKNGIYLQLWQFSPSGEIAILEGTIILWNAHNGLFLIFRVISYPHPGNVFARTHPPTHTHPHTHRHTQRELQEYILPGLPWCKCLWMSWLTVQFASEKFRDC